MLSENNKLNVYGIDTLITIQESTLNMEETQMAKALDEFENSIITENQVTM